jgi:hypothetical protein
MQWLVLFNCQFHRVEVVLVKIGMKMFASFLFIIRLSDHSCQQPFHDMGGENAVRNNIAISPDIIPDGSLIDTPESVLF